MNDGSDTEQEIQTTKLKTSVQDSGKNLKIPTLRCSDCSNKPHFDIIVQSC